MIDKPTYQEVAAYDIQNILKGIDSPRAVLKLTQHLFLITYFYAIAEERGIFHGSGDER